MQHFLFFIRLCVNNMHAHETIKFSNLDYYNSEVFQYTEGIVLKTTMALYSN